MCQEPISGTLVERSRFQFLTPFRIPDTFSDPNIDCEAWGAYLGDPPLAMAFLDRMVDGAIILKTKGQSYRAHRAEQASASTRPRK